MRPKECCHGDTETVYFLSVPVCAGAWWRFIVQTHTAPNSQHQLTNGERSPANEPSFHQTFGLGWWRRSPFPHRVNTQRSERPGTDLESAVPGKTLRKQWIGLAWINNKHNYKRCLDMELVRSYCIFDMQRLAPNMLAVQVVLVMRTKMDGDMFPFQKQWMSQHFFIIISCLIFFSHYV